MVKFSKILGLATTALVFAGISFGQTFTCTGSAAAAFAGPPYAAGTPTAATNVAPTIDAVEDTTALVSDILFYCPSNAANALSNGNVSVTLSLPVTSKALKVGNETTLVVQIGVLANAAPTFTAVGAPTLVVGTVSGSTVTFSSVNFPGPAQIAAAGGGANGYSVQISDVRANTSTGALGSQVTESVLVENQGVVAYYVPSTQVGLINQGFAVPALVKGSVTAYTVCTGNPVATATQSFQFTIAELFGGAFKSTSPSANTATGVAYTCGGATCTQTNGEGGPYVAVAGVVAPYYAGVALAGAATHGSRFAVTFAGVPSGVTIYIPVSVNSGAIPAGTVANQAVLNLTTNPTGAFAAVTANPPTGTTTVPAGFWPVPISGGAGTAYYEVVQTDNTVQTESFTISGYSVAAANFATTAQAAFTATVTPAPTAGSTVSDIPAYAASSNAALTLNAFSLCQTTLLFPYVVNQSGFDVGIVLSNTAADPLAASTTAAANVTATKAGGTGACTLNFYGANAPTPSTGVATPAGFSTNGTLAPGATGSFLLSTVAPNFNGYMIAVCGFLYGHGTAYIIDNFGQPAGTAFGYLALVMPYTVGAPRTVLITNGAAEGLLN